MTQSTAAKAKRVNGVGTWEGLCLLGISRLAKSRNGLVSHDKANVPIPSIHYNGLLGHVLISRVGTCTDVHESIETKLAARRMRQQLLSVITHANITIFTVDPDRKITMLEGALIWDADTPGQDDSKWYIGGNVDEVFNCLNPELPEGERPDFLSAIDSIFSRRSADVVVEHAIDTRFYRTRLLPMTGKKVKKGEGLGESSEIEGAIGVIMDVTEIKAKEAVLQAQALEKQQLLAREAAAKEASRLKSQFLANVSFLVSLLLICAIVDRGQMSHEIRTPITGVIGMAELLLDVELNEEQRDYAENIYRSANALLTVINDILDFSKVESGRLDIEEVQFSMSVIGKFNPSRSPIPRFLPDFEC